ncbi:Putrescine importer PuuP [Mycolicibacterium conceptionense]|uniref:Putrescine importer PuuP n=1 Tax=Mycolicibacterium conceptionense TaxID=451644 RepID=A0A1A2UW28_9MYCO|nr:MULTISPECIES: APC family permease [Mycolicibacterium]MCW1820837.1 APC family permease [Mycolicibacterium senegalense]OBB14199.1 Putrescine importer PuuP [Mycolicibacterium conceptionense]OBF07239.1 Putrescine importer PuuP [Mycolicibacterium conceptionense]OBF28118.1 Putrescine importer PuuP [Mycolicibacterium conceptionense]OBF38641.1 Putrescine importer PuuP [Mycolicibacterium conceptionense]
MTSPSAGQPTLVRALGLRSLVLFGLAYMTPLIVLGIFGVVASTTSGASASAYLIALAAMLFTASSYGRMAAAYPVSGSAYTYVRRTIDPRVGFLTGWAVLLDYLFLPMVIWLIGAAYLDAQFPGVPGWLWVLAFILITTVLNVVGIKVADKANYLLMAFQLLVIGLFVALSVASVVRDSGAGGLISAGPFSGIGASIGGVTAGAAIAAYSFLGFDAVTTFTEEAVEPRKNMPRAILLIALIGGAIFLVIAYTTQLVHPGGEFADSSSAALEIAKQIGGNLFGAVFLAGLILAQFASGIAAQASASRLLFAMGRDGTLPRAVFGTLSAKFRTPAANLVMVGAVGLLAMFLDVATSTSFINFGAFVAFTLVNVSVIVYYFRHRAAGESRNPLLYVVAPAIGAVITSYLLLQLDARAIILGLCWLGLGIIVLAVTSRGFKKLPPEIAVDEAEAATAQTAG